MHDMMMLNAMNLLVYQQFNPDNAKHAQTNAHSPATRPCTHACYSACPLSCYSLVTSLFASAGILHLAACSLSLFALVAASKPTSAASSITNQPPNSSAEHVSPASGLATGLSGASCVELSVSLWFLCQHVSAAADAVCGVMFKIYATNRVPS